MMRLCRPPSPHARADQPRRRPKRTRSLYGGQGSWPENPCVQTSGLREQPSAPRRRCESEGRDRCGEHVQQPGSPDAMKCPRSTGDGDSNCAQDCQRSERSRERNGKQENKRAEREAVAESEDNTAPVCPIPLGRRRCNPSIVRLRRPDVQMCSLVTSRGRHRTPSLCRTSRYRGRW